MAQTRSLTSKITAFVCLLIISLVTILGYGTFSIFERQLKVTIAKNQFSMTAALADEIDQKLLFAHQLLITIAKSVPVSTLSDPDQAQQFLDNQTILHRIFDNRLLLFTPQGKIFVESPFFPDRRGLDYSYRAYYKNTVATLAPLIAEPYISGSSTNQVDLSRFCIGAASR